LRELQACTGRSLPSILSELATCWREGFAPWEYLVYKFYEAPVFQKRAMFLSRRKAERLNDKLNARSNWVLVDDKLICQSRLEQAGLPVPKVHAVFSPHPRTCLSSPVYQGAEQIRDFLERADFPLFMKPIADGQGNRCRRIESWDGSSLKTFLGKVPMSKLLEWVEQDSPFGDAGLFLSEVIQPHPDLRDWHSSTSTVRIGVLLTPSGPVILRTSIRIPVGHQVKDNFDPSEGINMAAQVAPESGVVGNAVSGFGVTERAFTHHPDSGVPIAGLQLPHWQRAREVVLTGSLLFPGLKFQHWDIALTESGPVVLEVNVRGGIQLYQQPASQPFMDEAVRDLLEPLIGY
jgi:hypothetical protein